MCPICCASYVVKKDTKHICGMKYCRIRKDVMPIRHECYIAPTKRSAKPKHYSIIMCYICFATLNAIKLNSYQKMILRRKNMKSISALRIKSAISVEETIKIILNVIFAGCVSIYFGVI